MFNAGFNPYSAIAKEGLFSALKTKINWGTILTNTQKTLNIVNQAIPLVYQIKPIVNNAKTIFKVIGAIKSDNNTNITPNTSSTYKSNYSNVITNHNTNSNKNITSTSINKNQPVFFL